MKPTDPSVPSPAGNPDDAWLESVLRDTARTHIADDGFSAGVVAALPSPRTKLGRWRRTIVLTVGALGGGGLALAFGGAESVEFVLRTVESALERLAPYFPSADVLVLIAGAAIAAAVIGFSNWRLWRSR